MSSCQSRFAILLQINNVLASLSFTQFDFYAISIIKDRTARRVYKYYKLKIKELGGEKPKNINLLYK